MDEQTNSLEKPRLIVTHGEKGGVGKTTVARVIADYLKSHDVAFRAFDAEGPTGQLLRFHPTNTAAVDISSATTVAPILDYLMDGIGKRTALVDLGAHSGEDLRVWLYRGGALEEAEAGNLGVTIVYVLGDAVDSVGHLKECYAALGKDMRYVVVKNRGVASKFDIYDQSNIRRDLLAIGAREISFPGLDPSVYQSVDRVSATFADFAENKNGNFGFTERRYCRTWLKDCYTAFDQVGTLLR